ncbi:hypothetical protein Bca4012_032548 [Brassica carinata]
MTFRRRSKVAEEVAVDFHSRNRERRFQEVFRVQWSYLFSHQRMTIRFLDTCFVSNQYVHSADSSCGNCCNFVESPKERFQLVLVERQRSRNASLTRTLMEFQRIFELKGLKKADQQSILNDFNKHGPGFTEPSVSGAMPQVVPTHLHYRWTNKLSSGLSSRGLNQAHQRLLQELESSIS